MAEAYLSDRYEVFELKCQRRLLLKEKYFHALGAIHGSVYFKLLDDAAFFAASSIVEDVFVLTTSFTINITKPVSQGTIKAIGNVRFESNNLIENSFNMLKFLKSYLF